ncbi:MAG: uracil-DNA glycosylase [Rhodospirillaceae bacterium]|nr:uracil-DNA glycosylase [Rhodospirillaceae bacterium]|tara:strand:- start:23161 stop:24003 length:843 start_codon:yes stop_codon:yes gene_type:complete
MVEENSATELLKWYVESGVDEALEESPVDRFKTTEKPSNQARPSTATGVEESVSPSAFDTPPAISPRTATELISLDEATKTARSLANAANTLEELRTALAAFDGCPLKQTAKSLVFGDGSGSAQLMFIGEAPGAQEDRQGLPFVGPAGQLLDRMLAAISLQRSDVYITNILPWRPPGNRTPTDSEIAACIPFIERHIELVTPQILVLVGGTSAKTLLGTTQGIMRTRGKWLEYNRESMSLSIPARAILHPAYLLRSPAQKRETWMDLLEIRQKLEQCADR